MAIDEKKLRSDLEEIGKLLAFARDMAGLKQPEAAALVGVREKTVGNWESAAGEGGALKPLLYLRRLCQRDARSRDFALQILGLQKYQEADKKLEKRLEPIRRAMAEERAIPGLQNQIDAIENLLEYFAEVPTPKSVG